MLSKHKIKSLLNNWKRRFPKKNCSKPLLWQGRNKEKTALCGDGGEQTITLVSTFFFVAQNVQEKTDEVDVRTF